MPKSVQNILFHSFFVPGAPSAAFRRETLPSWQKPRESSHSCPQTRRGRKIMCKSPLTAEAQIWYTMYHFVGEILKRSTRADCKSAGLRLLRFESLSRHHYGNSVTPGFLFYSKQVSILPRAQSIKFTLEKKASGGFLGRRRIWIGCPGWTRTTSKGIKNLYAAITSPDNGVRRASPKPRFRQACRQPLSLLDAGRQAENRRAAARHEGFSRTGRRERVPRRTNGRL